MIPDFAIAQWRQTVPWAQDYQVEQDLIICRALIDLYNNPEISNHFSFRGGTALYKLYVTPPARYSEDIDLVQISPGPIGEMINEIRRSLSWLGEPTRKLTERSAKLVYKFQACDNTSKKLKIEINTTEHFHVLGIKEKLFSIENPWYSGEAVIQTYEINELIGTKLRALYQRRKGRDLFDLWVVLNMNVVDPQIVIQVLLKHYENQNMPMSKKLFERNLTEKIKFSDFKEDVLALLSHSSLYSFDEAYSLVHQEFISLIP
jgi:predicted nucleotidyltransferase component of viral defense system